LWLNEGIATYVERRIVEAVHGRDRADLSWALGRRELQRAVQTLEARGGWAFTRLRMQLGGVDPIQAASSVPFEKGALLLRAVEEVVGRPALDRFLRQYIARFRFAALTTEEFVAFLGRELPQAVAQVDVHGWVTAPGVPPEAPWPGSARLSAIDHLAGAIPPSDLAKTWTGVEWDVYLTSLPKDTPASLLAELDQRFGLTATTNPHVLHTWLVLAARAGYTPALSRVEGFLGASGRVAHLRPLFDALLANPSTRAWARQLYDQFSAGYHPIARRAIEHALSSANVAPPREPAAATPLPSPTSMAQTATLRGGSP
jgi:hypothetical protein